MSASMPETSIFTVDHPKLSKRKSGTPSQAAKALRRNNAKKAPTQLSAAYSNTTSSYSKRTAVNWLNANADAEAAKCFVANAKKT